MKNKRYSHHSRNSQGASSARNSGWGDRGFSLFPSHTFLHLASRKLHSGFSRLGLAGRSLSRHLEPDFLCIQKLWASPGLLLPSAPWFQ